MERMSKQFAEISFGIPHGHLSPDPTSAPGRMHLDKADRDKVEDKIRQVIDSWTEEEQATAYWYLYASGMNLEKAKTIRRKARFVS